jgi:hypothetical protein
MPKITQIEGHYQIKGNTLSNTKHKFLVVQRENPTKKKGKSFLLHVDIKGKREYVSSLYSTTTDNLFKFDYYGKEYRLVLIDEPLIVLIK